jgi:Glyoxalase-like domain
VPLRLDHVIYGVTDVDAATAMFEVQHQLTVADGGTHPDGTRNRVVWCADRSYVELLAVDVPTSPEAQWVQDEIAAGKRLLGWAVRADGLSRVSDQLGLPVVGGSIEYLDGQTGSWRIVGADEAMAEPWLPFFIRYSRTSGRSALVESDAGVPDHLGWIEVAGDAARLREWLGDASLPVRVVDGASGVQAVGVVRGESEIVIW